MHPLLAVSFVAATLLSACANQEAAPAKAEAASVARKAPQCWNGDAGKFQDVGIKTSISGVAVECKSTSDGKAAQWMGAKH